MMKTKILNTRYITSLFLSLHAQLSGIHLNRIVLVLTFILLHTNTSFAQQKDWQWVKRGGAKMQGSQREAVNDIATDSDRNVYITAPIGNFGLNIDGNPKNYYGGTGGNLGEYALASFACDGTYRWSKIIGGKNQERPFYVENDGNDNLYLAGRFSSCDADVPNKAPARIENDIILDQDSNNCTLLIIAKYDKNGNLLWYRQPQEPTNTSDAFTYTHSANISVDSAGNLHWLVNVPAGSYANGAFINTLQGINWFVFTYDPSGNFINATHLDSIQFANGAAGQLLYDSIKMYRNPNNGFYYLTGSRDSNAIISINGQNLTGSLYLACYDDQGNFQWMRQNTLNSVAAGTIINGLEFDAQNNIYMGGKFIGDSLDVFLGQSVSEKMLPRFVMKTNPDATSVSWFSYSTVGFTTDKGGFVMDDHTVYYTNASRGQNFTWGNQSIDINIIDEGNEVLIASFDKNTGACTSLDFIEGNADHSDYGTALAIDANGDLLVGGEFGHILYDANGGSVMNPSPGNPDFFIAKYATEPCPVLDVVEAKKANIEVWPNPTHDKIHLSGMEADSYRLYDIYGKLVQKGQLAVGQKSIDLKAISSGAYLLELKNAKGIKHVVKVLKE